MRFSGISRKQKVAITAVSLIALASVACGSDSDTPAPAASQPTAAPIATAIPPTPVVVVEAPTPTPESTPEPVRKLSESKPVVFDAGDTDIGELEGPAAHIQARAAERYEALRLKDWDNYLESCLPATRHETTIADLERDYAFLTENRYLTPEGFSVQVGNVMVLGAIDAIVEKSFYEFDEKFVPSEGSGGDHAEIWTMVDGEWYSAGCGLVK